MRRTTEIELNRLDVDDATNCSGECKSTIGKDRLETFVYTDEKEKQAIVISTRGASSGWKEEGEGCAFFIHVVNGALICTVDMRATRRAMANTSEGRDDVYDALVDMSPDATSWGWVRVPLLLQAGDEL